MENKDFLGTEPIKKLLFKLAMPTVIAQIINMLYNVVDRIYIGHMPNNGSLALTGVGVCMPIILIVSAFAALVSSGGSPFASISMGEGDYKRAEKILGQCFFLQIIVSIILTILLELFGESFLLAFGASESTITYALSYLRIYALGTIFVELTLGMNTFITAQGFATTGMYTVLIGAICNIILDPIFIFVFNMEVSGAAFATIISQCISTIWVIHFLRSDKSNICLKKENIKLEKDIILPCISLGLASFIMQASESIISVCFNSSLQRYGGDIAVGAMTILSSVMQLAMLPMQGIGQGAQPIASYNFGAKNKERLKDTFKCLLIACLTYSIFLWGLIMLFPKLFASIFSSDILLINYTANVLRIYCASLGLFGIQIACQMLFVSIGNAKCSIIVAVLRKFVLLIPLIYIIPNLVSDKTIGVYLAEPIADSLAVTFTAILFFFEFRKALKKLDGE